MYHTLPEKFENEFNIFSAKVSPEQVRIFLPLCVVFDGLCVFVEAPWTHTGAFRCSVALAVRPTCFCRGGGIS